MRSETLIATPSFSGHESFPLRFAWLKKGYDALSGNKAFFSTDDAMVELGVGKNMVRSIRHWGLCCGVWTEDAESRGRALDLTEIGHSMLDNEGWDPYLEDPATIWWLHWSVVRNRDRATAWTWVFGMRGGISRFTRDELVAELEDLQSEFSGRQAPRSSLKRDVEVLVRSYARSRGDKSIEDALDSPFAELGLIRPGPERGTFELLAGDWPSLPLGVFEAALVDFCASRPRVRTFALNELLYDPGSPGRVFRLTETGMVRRLIELTRRGWLFDETAGLRQLIVPESLPEREVVLDAHYAYRPSRDVA